MFDLRPLSREAIPAALGKAERYRLLNESEMAESICEDILAADSDNRQAIVTMILAITDQFRGEARVLVGFACTPAEIDANVAPVGPSQLLKTLQKRRFPGHRLRVGCGKGQKHADAPHARVCCALATSGQAAAPPSPAMNSRRRS